MDKAVHDYAVELHGRNIDESPFVYRNLQAVLDAHEGKIDLIHTLRPVSVVMAGA